MQLVLKIKNGDLAGKKLLLRQGQVAKVGRTEWADFSVPCDESLAEYHFEIRCEASGCSVSELDGNALKIDGQPPQGFLRHGQTVAAGETEFAVELIGFKENKDETEAVNTENAASVETPADPAPQAQEPTTAAEYVEALELSEDAAALLPKLPSESPLELMALTISHQMYQDAISLAAAQMPKRDAIGWAMECIHSTGRRLGADETLALGGVQGWLDDPSDSNRREAKVAAAKTGLTEPGSWLAMGAFWSEGSMAPADQPMVESPWQLTTKAIVAALMIDATKGDPTMAPKRYEHYLELSDSYLSAAAK